MKYEFLNNLSGAVVMFAVTFAFIMLFESRFSKKVYLRTLIPFLLCLFLLNLAVIYQRGFADYGRVAVLIGTLPTLLYFFLVSLHRDGRFFFTFCLVDTSAIWFALVTGFFDYFLGGQGLINGLLRIGLTPLILYGVYRHLRKPFLGILHTVRQGWWLFSGLTAVVYVILVMVSSFPTGLRHRPDDIPLAIVIALFLPMVYAVMFYILLTQQSVHEKNCLESALAAQAAIMNSRAEEIRGAEQLLQAQRQELSSRLDTIEALSAEGRQEELSAYLRSLRDRFQEQHPQHYCENPVLNAILSSCFQKAEQQGVEVEKHLLLPKELPVPSEELAAVMGNALEIAIASCEGLPQQQRKIVMTVISSPSLMMEIRNGCQEEKAGSEGDSLLPSAISGAIGFKSILAFCQKYDAAYLTQVKDGWFTLMLAL